MRQGWQRLQNSEERDPLMNWQHVVVGLTAMTRSYQWLFAAGSAQHIGTVETSSFALRAVLEGQGWFVTRHGIYARYCNDQKTANGASLLDGRCAW